MPISDKIPTTEKDHLDFYLENKISPVRQDISDLQRHLTRRGSLYRYLGVLPQMIMGRQVLEVGPGSGHNSLFVAHCQPDAYDLLEPNPVAGKEIRELYSQFSLKHTLPRIIPQRLEEFQIVEYDLVISEAWLGVSEHERQLMKKLAGFVKPGGILIVTLSSPIGMLANTLRRILGYMLVKECSSFEEKTNLLLKAFGGHLKTMENMSRPHIDWVQDSLLNPGFLTMHPTPAMLFADIGHEYSLYNSFPRIHTDWRWYKSLYGNNLQFNENFLNSYFTSCHNLFDYKDISPPRSREENTALESDCFYLMSIVADYEDKNVEIPFTEITEKVRNIQNNIEGFSQEWG
ncbi:class I SAM-dependent methyltransferase, partial [Pseudomonadota bacterium]